MANTDKMSYTNSYKQNTHDKIFLQGCVLQNVMYKEIAAVMPSMAWKSPPPSHTPTTVLGASSCRSCIVIEMRHKIIVNIPPHEGGGFFNYGGIIYPDLYRIKWNILAPCEVISVPHAAFCGANVKTFINL